MKKLFLMLSVALLAFTACSNDDNPAEEVTDDNVTGSWICQYAEDGISWFDDPYDNIVQYYRFLEDGTGFYELYYFKDNELIGMDYGRDWYEDFKYTAIGGKVTVTYELDEESWTLSYANKQLTDQQGHRFAPSTEEQDEQVLEWFTSQHIAGDDDEDITYINRYWSNGAVRDEEVTAKAQWLNAATVSGNPWEIGGTWYVTGSYTIDVPIKVSGELKLILCDDAVLRAKCIVVEGDNKMRIYGQKRETGQLIIDDTPHCPAIGPDKNPGGYIVIYGGNITAKGSNGCAAIGGGYRTGTTHWGWENYAEYFNSIAIYGGVIHATGGGGGAGIGGGAKANGVIGDVFIYGGDITAQGGGYAAGLDVYGGAGIGGGGESPIAHVFIRGGNIHATGGSEAAGIGCGQGAEGKGFNGEGFIVIQGGNVEAHGADHGAGIGGGDGVYLEEIFISDGVVKAYGGVNAAGIGGGEGAQGGKINISRGTVYAYAGADGAGIGGGEDGDGGEITIESGLVFAYGNYHSNGFGAGIGGGQDGNSGTITIKGGEVHAYGGDDAAGIGTGEETTSGPNIKADNITISGGTVEAVGGGYGAGVGAGQDAEVGTITITTESGSVYVSGRSGNDCGWWAGAFGAYKEDARGTLNIGKGVKTMSIETDYSWSTIPVAWNPVAFAQQRCHVLIQTCDHPGYTAETCIFCKH